MEGDRHGNLVFKDAARNVNPLAAIRGRLRFVELAPGVALHEVLARTGRALSA